MNDMINRWFGWLDRDWDTQARELAVTKVQLERLQENYRITHKALIQAELERNVALDTLKTCKENMEASKGALIAQINAKEAQIADLRARLEQTTIPNATSDLMAKEMPVILKLKTDKQETIYQTGFGIYIGTKKLWYDFETPTVPVHLGGVAWPYIADKGQFRQGMTAKEVFTKSLKIVQEKYGYRTDESLYGPLDSWAPPLLTHMFKQGDCEDSTQFVVNIFLTYEQVYGAFKDYYCAIGVGYVGSLCHAFPVLIKVSSDKPEDHLIGEATASAFAPPKSFAELKKYYKISLGVIGHPTVRNASGGFVVKPEARFWKGAGTQGIPGAEPGEKPPDRVNGHTEEKKALIKQIWGTP